MRPARRRGSVEVPGSLKAQPARKQVSFNNQIEQPETPDVPRRGDFWGTEVEVHLPVSSHVANANIQLRRVQ
jgi:hypothetical protein